MEVATPQAWASNPKLVLEFYNKRREQLLKAHPNEAHHLLASLEQHYDVTIITQNIDDLHERAGSTNVVHLHGELLKARSSVSNKLYDLPNGTIEWGDVCEQNSQLRPHVVWFGEEVPLIPLAEQIVQGADILIIIGTSLMVYPAAGLTQFAAHSAAKYLIDPGDVPLSHMANLSVIKEKASKGMTLLAQRLIDDARING
jgi:NAD-dependent deacetylase